MLMRQIKGRLKGRQDERPHPALSAAVELLDQSIPPIA
jgi:hypothetical protein